MSISLGISVYYDNHLNMLNLLGFFFSPVKREQPQ